MFEKGGDKGRGIDRRCMHLLPPCQSSRRWWGGGIVVMVVVVVVESGGVVDAVHLHKKRSGRQTDS